MNRIKLDYLQFLKASIFVFLSVVLITIQIFGMHSTSITFDDGYNASVSKNLSMGLGYVTSYNNYVYFNPEITTGPTILMPVSILISIFGNKNWVPGLGASICINIGLILIFYFLYKTKFTNKTGFFLLFITTLFLFLANIYLYTLIGEVPAVLFAIASIIIFSKFTKKSLFVAGIIFSLALLTKLIVAICFLGFFSIIIAKLLQNKTKGSALVLVKTVIFFVLGLLIVLLPWVIFSKLSVKPIITSNVTSTTPPNQFFEVMGSGIEPFKKAENKLQYLINNSKNNSKILIYDDYGGKPFQVIIFVFITVLLMVFPIRNIINTKKASVTDYILIALNISFLAHLIWWLSFSNLGWYRHLLPALLYWGASFSLTVIRSPLILKQLLLLLFIIFISNTNLTNSNLITTLSPKWEKSERLISLESTAKKISEIKSLNKSAIFAGCLYSGNRDLEYLLPTSLNFYKCDLINNSEYINNNVYLVTSVDWSNWDNYPEYNTFKKSCEINENIKYKDSYFTISVCKKAPEIIK